MELFIALRGTNRVENSAYFATFLTIWLWGIPKSKKLRYMQGFSTVELRRVMDSNPRRGYKPLTHLAG